MSGNPTAAEIAQRFDGRRNGKGWSIPCPSPTHIHKNPSRKDRNCSVLDGHNGKLIVKCFSQNCSRENILEGLGVSYEDKKNKTGECIAVYSHPDGIMRRVYRIDTPEKIIWQEKGVKIKGCYLLLWGDDKLNKTIVIVEGEKAANSLRNHLINKNAENAGIPASYIGGVKNVENANYEVCLGRNVTIWPDNDEEGLIAGNKLANKVKDAGASVIKIVDVSDLIYKGDADDVDENLAIDLLINAKVWNGSSDPYEPYNSQESYEPRDPDTGEPKSKSRGGSRDGAGRPKSNSPTYQTLANRRTEHRTELRNWLFNKKVDGGKELPKRFWMDDLVDSDVERNLHYSINKYCTDGEKVYVFYEAVWVKLDTRNEKSIRAIAQSTLNNRAEAALDLGNNYCDYEDEYDNKMSSIYSKELRNLTTRARHCIEVMRTISISGNQNIKIIPKIDFDQRNNYPIVPLSDGTTIDLTKFPPVILEADQVPEDTLILDHGWMIPKPDFELLDSMKNCTMDNTIRNHYGEKLFTRVASHLLGIDKSIDCFTAESDSGKSTLADILMQALPGAVGMHGARGLFHKDGQRFTPVADALSKYLITIIDEVGHPSIEIKTSTVNEWVQDTIDRERKGEQRTSVRRISSIFMVGHTYPHVNFSDQGIQNRFKWAYDGSSIPKLDSSERFKIIQKDQIDYLRAWLFYKAAELWNEHGSTTNVKKALEQDEEIQNAVNIMADSRKDPVSSLLTEYFEEDKNGFVTSARIDEVLSKLEDDKPKGRALSNAITRTFHSSHVRSGRKSIEGKQVYVWKGIRDKMPDSTNV